jgi:molybdate transport repressor ModE-like protein
MISLSGRKLQVLVAIAETGSFAGAARRLGIAQPSVSAHVQAIEREAGVVLFERASGRQASLTEAGRSVLDHARESLALALRLEEELDARGSSAATTISFACQRSLAHTILRAPLAAYARERRDVRLSVRIAFQEDVLAAVRMGGADVGCLIADAPPDDLPSILVGRQRFVVFAAPDHPLAGRARVAPGELARADFVGPVASSLFGRTQRRLLSRVGVERMHIVAEGTEFSLVRDLVMAGVGLGCSLHSSVQADVEAGRVCVIDLDAPELFLEARLLMNPKRANNRKITEFAQFLARGAELAEAPAQA